MNRRQFLIRSAWLGTGALVLATSRSLANVAVNANHLRLDSEFYKLFRTPEWKYHPYVRWWWNGDKIEAPELVRELQLLKAAGVGGVEINPVKFPADTDDMGKKSLQWLSNEWIDMLKVAFDEAKRLEMTCDLIVGSGWPFGAEYLEGDERAQAMVIGVKRITGPLQYETSMESLLLEADPLVSHPFAGRIPKIVSLQLVPDPISEMSQVVDLTSRLTEAGRMGSQNLKIEIPEGKHVLYALVQISGFAGVIMGAPGAAGPSLNHLNTAAVNKYLNKMSDTIEARIGPLKNYIRAFFTDSLELEGANWCNDMPAEFKRRNGYDIMPYLQFMMYKTGGMGNIINYEYGASMSPEFRAMIDRMRYDFELTKAEMFRERFTIPYTQWCRRLGVKSRAQAYGRGFLPLESGMQYDIPEGESWTTNFLQHRLGEEMSNEDYRRGRAYTMINKYISSGAHLSGKRWVSCEEMTNTYRVFNATLEFLKMGSDMSINSGITHSIYHGFNYSPPEAAFPGWVIYGSYYNERNNWWPYFPYLNAYKGRLSSVLTNAEMYADIAILPPVADMWTTIGVQNEPFPSHINEPYQTLVWEALCKNGSASDYLSEEIIRQCEVRSGRLCYNKRSYRELFMIGVERTDPATLTKLYEFVKSGGRVFCIDKEPTMALGWNNNEQRDEQVKALIKKLKTYPERFVLLEKPADDDFMGWYAAIQQKYQIKPYIEFSEPSLYVMQNRYQSDSGAEIFFINNAHLHNGHRTRVSFPAELTRQRQGWVWDANTGEKYRLTLTNQGVDIDLGPTESMLIVFNKEAYGNAKIWAPLPVTGQGARELTGEWQLELKHSLDGSTRSVSMEELADLKDTPYVEFTGTAIYRKSFNYSPGGSTPGRKVLNLGKVYGISELWINGTSCGVSWYGRRLYDVAPYLQEGNNEIEVRVTTTMGNYLQTLTDNKIVQKWTNRPGRPQPTQSMGLAGPVTLY